ncbi:hypothetical protein GCM10009565_00110 [Amycolatopsis albidoflavus]
MPDCCLCPTARPTPTAPERRFRASAVIRHLSTGLAPKQVARLLDLSVHTVNDHLRSIYGKTGAHGRNELIAALNP